MNTLPPIVEEPVVLSHCDECGRSYDTTLEKRFDRLCDRCRAAEVRILIATPEYLAQREREDDMAIEQRDRDRNRCGEFK